MPGGRRLAARVLSQIYRSPRKSKRGPLRTPQRERREGMGEGRGPEEEGLSQTLTLAEKQGTSTNKTAKYAEYMYNVVMYLPINFCVTLTEDGWR